MLWYVNVQAISRALANNNNIWQATHAVYNKFEVDPANIPATALLLMGVPAIPGYLLALHTDSASLAVVLAFGVFYATLVASIVLYRISPLHPLAKYPGPFWLKISKFATMYHALGGKQYSFFKGLHDKYGPFVRVGGCIIIFCFSNDTRAMVGSRRPERGLDC